MEDIYSDEIRKLVILLWIETLHKYIAIMTEFWFTG